MATILCKRGTRAQIDAAAAAGELLAGEPYYVTDEYRLAVGLSPTECLGMLRQGESVIWQEELDLGNISGAVTIDVGNGNKQAALIAGNCTITLASPFVSSHVRLLLLNVYGGHAITWPFDMRWVGGAAPDFSTEAGAIHVVVLEYSATGDLWIADGGPL